ncbi:MAG: Holliday junction branch migration protein RuvA [Pelagibacterales bacterium]|jgi:Holliday junction DNA helicase RuvA|nr:Holliday junction branch migration protein RuvA [Pelagibacterales bacterium]OUV28197.1 MAG: Holliday junction branch migration protein RuvA [Alphaproteobacteria bacterium TMED109]RCL83088.1 MAG: Holliday junction branch migration protein RuvA [Alphaproteobacteria bacterium]|tara:strand:+ start:2110 stop:2706 length:597 start_codon:yes stop_codon:yes gene_type:complete
MIAKLRGIIDQIGEDYIIIDVSGVGYLVYCSSKVINKLSTKGQLDEILIQTIVREDQITLYGFKEENEKYWFDLLLKVQGVGAKTAIKGLSIMTPEELEMAILSEDKTLLTRIPGIGNKGALRICSELKDKTLNISIQSMSKPKQNSNIQDLISGLIGLGYGHHEAYEVISKLSNDDKSKKVEDMLQIALKIISEKRK